MTFTLQVDGQRWRASSSAVRDSVRSAIASEQHVDGDLVPVIKGNGYGFGNQRLVNEARRLGLTRIAVGTIFEAADLLASTDADVLVLTPFDPRDVTAGAVWSEVASSQQHDRVIRTVADPAAWAALAAGPGPVRLVIEGLTSMGRFGMSADEIADLLSSPKTADVLISGRIQLEGLALHLPLTQPQTNHRAIPGARWHDAVVAPVAPAHLTARATEAWRWGLGWQVILADVSERLNSSPLVQGQRAVTAFTSAAALWVSHLDDGELGSLRAALPDIEMFPRIGTRLWLGDRAAFRAQGTVLAVNQVSKGTAAGYRQRRAPGNGAILVIGGGTAHGVALSAPSNVSSVRQRAVAAGTGVLEAAGRSLSPFIIDGSQRWFIEPPHMQVSLIHVPSGIAVPSVGEHVSVEVRMTTAHFDAVLGLDD